MSIFKMMATIFALSCLTLVKCDYPVTNFTAVGIPGNASAGIMAPGTKEGAILPSGGVKDLPPLFLIPGTSPPLYLNRVYHPTDGQPINLKSLSRPIVFGLQAIAKTIGIEGISWLPVSGVIFNAPGSEGILIVPVHAQSMSSVDAVEVLYGIWDIMLDHSSQTCTYQVAEFSTIPIGSVTVFDRIRNNGPESLDVTKK